MKRVFPHWGLLSVCFVASACASEFAPASLIDEARVIGAELRVVGEPERPLPRPGESVDVQWWVASVDDAPFTWVMAACEARTSPVGRPFCIGAPFAVAGSETPSAMDPSFRLEVPGEIGLGNEVLVLGVLCPAGVPEVNTFGGARDLTVNTVCSEGAGQILAQSLRVHDDSSNVSPAWPAAAVFIDGLQWDAAGCPVVRAESIVDITLGEFPDAARETYERSTNDLPPRTIEYRENLLISHFTTHGEFSRHFSVVDGESEIRPVEWTLPAELAGEVQLSFVLRDGRGGASLIERRACIE